MSSMHRTQVVPVCSIVRVLRHAGKLALATALLSALTLLWLGIDSRVARAEAIETFAAHLSGADEASPNTEISTGRAVMTVVTDTLYYRISVADIDNITAAHIHEGPPGTDGPVIFTLYDGSSSFDPSQPVSGTLTLTPTQKSKLQAGDYYVNVHTTAYSGGEIRGQLEPMVLEADYNALLLGRNEVDPVATAASGVANFTLTTTDTYTLTYHLAVSEIVSITAAHIHRGPAGTNGPVVHGLYNGVGPFDPANPISGTVYLNARDLLDLLTGYFYVNVHTVANPDGEIRGQIGGPRLFAANLATANETASVESIASGRAVLALSRDTTELTYRVLVDDIQDIQMAHIHRGLFGVDGPVIFPLYNQAGGGAFDPAHPISGTLVITPAQVFDLIADRYYINVHTTQYGGGEIRGQVTAFTPPTHLNAALTGEGEPSAVETDAVGIARLTFDEQNMVLHHTVVITDIVDVTAAHIHLGPRGVNGPVIFPLYTQADGGVFGPDSPVGGGHNLNAAHLVDLFTGFYYINVHTTANPGGEIRGQIGGAQIYQASLSGAEEVEPVTTVATGRGILALSADTTSLAYRVTVNRIEDVTAAHIHLGERGVNGDIIFGLFATPGVFDSQHPVSGTVAINANQVLDLIAGNYYINVHTTVHSGGEIRGQVESYAPRSHLHAIMNGAQEVTPAPAGAAAINAVDTDAVGIARLTLDSDLNMVRYSLAVTDIVDIIAAHIHLGPTGVSGPIRYTLFGGNIPFGPGEPIADAAVFDASAWVDLLSGYHYVNVHTTEYPAGEIRGQLGGASLFQAEMTGGQEVPPVETPAKGEAVLAVSADTTQLSYRVQVEDIDNIIAAHIHKAPVGVDGDIVITLHDGSTAFTTDTPVSDTLPISTTQLFDLLQGNYYVNVHTMEEAGGEIRGQIKSYVPPADFISTLTTDAEVQPSQVDPSGTGAFHLDPSLGILYYSVAVTNVTNISITAAHIHRAPVGVNGPVIFFLYDGSGDFDAEHPVGGLHLLDGAQLVDLLTGFYYVNVHTVEQPSGAIRGQIEAFLQTYVPLLFKQQE